jgi:hypothetical protein
MTEWLKVIDCKSIGKTYTGSNPVLFIKFFVFIKLYFLLNMFKQRYFLTFFTGTIYNYFSTSERFTYKVKRSPRFPELRQKYRKSIPKGPTRQDFRARKMGHLFRKYAKYFKVAQELHRKFRSRAAKRRRRNLRKQPKFLLNRTRSSRFFKWLKKRKKNAYHIWLRRISLLKRYRHPFYISFINKNFFLQTSFSRLGSKFLISTGHFSDYKRNTKKKKTYVAGQEIIQFYLSNNVNLENLIIKTFFINLRGRLAARKGVLWELRELNYGIYRLIDKSYLSFNGSRAARKRRL